MSTGRRRVNPAWTCAGKAGRPISFRTGPESRLRAARPVSPSTRRPDGAHN
jgi:hypothetical protein